MRTTSATSTGTTSTSRAARKQQEEAAAYEANLLARFNLGLTLAMASDLYQAAKKQVRDSHPDWRAGAVDERCKRYAVAVELDELEEEFEKQDVSRQPLIDLREAMLAPLSSSSVDVSAPVDVGILEALNDEYDQRFEAVLEHSLHAETEKLLAANRGGDIEAAAQIAIQQVADIVVRLMQGKLRRAGDIRGLQAMRNLEAAIRDVTQPPQPEIRPQINPQPSTQPSGGTDASQAVARLQKLFDQRLAALATDRGMRALESTLRRDHRDWSEHDVARSAQWVVTFHILDEMDKESRTANSSIDPGDLVKLCRRVLLRIDWSVPGSHSNQFAQAKQLLLTFDRRCRDAMGSGEELSEVAVLVGRAMAGMTQAESVREVGGRIILDQCAQMRREGRRHPVLAAATERAMTRIAEIHPHLAAHLQAPTI